MIKTVKVVIGGKQYSLAGENEGLLKLSADEVNAQLENLVTKHGDLPDKTSYVLVALNLAEKNYLQQNGNEDNQKTLIDELNKMSDYIQNSLTS